MFQPEIIFPEHNRQDNPTGEVRDISMFLVLLLVLKDQYPKKI